MSVAVRGDAIDVLVVGSGIAGLAAAAEAAATGARTLVLEAAEEIGGASIISGASCCIVGTPVQEAAGVVDDVDLALEDWERMGGPVDRELVREYLERSRSEVFDWLSGLGLECARVTRPAGNSAARNHIVVGWGRAIVTAARARAEQLGVELRTGARVTSISDGTPVRVVVETRDGTETLTASAVVLATGGFAGAFDRVRDVTPRLSSVPRFVVGGAPGAQGDGHDLAVGLGGVLVGVENTWTYPIGTPDPQDPTGRRGLALRGAITDIWLNREGRRFHDESDRSGRSGTDALLAQPGQTAWSVFPAADLARIVLMNNEHYSTPVASDPAAVDEFVRDSAYAQRVDGLAEVAAIVGAPAEVVERDVLAFVSAIREGRDTDPATGRSLTGLEPMELDDLIVVQLFPIASKSLGGVRTDRSGRVVDAAGQPVGPVFAAGELVGGLGGAFNGTGSLEGTLFAPSIYSGRVAGRAAAAVGPRG